MSLLIHSNNCTLFLLVACLEYDLDECDKYGVNAINIIKSVKAR